MVAVLFITFPLTNDIQMLKTDKSFYFNINRTWVLTRPEVSEGDPEGDNRVKMSQV